MNLFFLDVLAVLAAQYMADIHVGKMAVETAQLLCSAYRWNSGQRGKDKRKRKKMGEELCRVSDQALADHAATALKLYKMAFFNHPMAKWTRTSRVNFEWALAHGKALCAEWKRRFHSEDDQTHGSMAIFQILEEHLDDIEFPSESQEVTVPVPCVGEEGDLLESFGEQSTLEDVVQIYRTYYTRRAAHLVMRWNKGTPAPPWWTVVEEESESSSSEYIVVKKKKKKKKAKNAKRKRNVTQSPEY